MRPHGHVAVWQVARELEDPFVTELGFWFGANRLYAPHLQQQFNERLLAVGDGSVAGDVDFKSEGVGGAGEYGVFLSYALGSEQTVDDDSLAQSNESSQDIGAVLTGAGRRGAGVTEVAVSVAP